jgi:hypothetical protein
MAALTAVFDAKRHDGKLVSYPMATVKIYKGAFVSVATATGFVQPAGDIAATIFVGVAYETVDNSVAGSSFGGRSIRVLKSGVFTCNSSSALQTDVGKTAYLVDDNTAKTAATANTIAAGTVVHYNSVYSIDVRIDGKVA